MAFFEDQECCACFVKFGVPHGFTAARRKDNATFYCPNGHGQSYRENEADKLRRERDLLKQQIAQRDDEIKRQKSLREDAEKTAAVRKGQVTRLKNRAAAGVCPCCNRTVSQMAKHMASKHPGFKAEEEVA